jgi:hypothetical protein
MIVVAVISPLFLEPSLALLCWQRGTLAAILSLLKIEVELAITLRYLPLAELIAVLLLLQHKQQIFLPVALQTPRNLFLTRLHPAVSERSQLMGIAFPS